jgi:hyperosmotically inducible periplasmic protein
MIFRIAALGIGAIAMYYLDPVSGKRRRALLRDQAVHAKHRISDYTEHKAKDLRNRAQGLVARSRRKLDIDLTQDLGR